MVDVLVHGRVIPGVLFLFREMFVVVWVFSWVIRVGCCVNGHEILS